MSKKALEDQKYEAIKAAILDPENSPLPCCLQESLERTVEAAKLLDKNPSQRNAVALLRELYPHISRSQAYEDCRRAVRVFNSVHTFNYDWWHHWLLQDITEMIAKAKGNEEEGTTPDLKAWAMGHKNLIKALGERPEANIDPKLIEKHPINIAVQINNQTVNLDYKEFLKLPAEAREIITKALDQEIDETQARQIMDS
jgi:hypothetical protein